MSKIRLILHIGAGKTGTSSIQKTLNSHKKILREKGIWYLGLMLEHAPKKYEWQKPSGSVSFHQLDKQELEKQLLSLFIEILDIAQKQNIHTLIWSNESFFARNEKMRDFLKVLNSKNVNIDILAYVRRHDAWARSAYMQWGLQHKTYIGKLMPFSTWVKKRPISFYEPLQSLMNDFPQQMNIRNMDILKDTTKDFLEYANINDNKISSIRSNESASNEELFLRTLFNSIYNDKKVLKKKFDNTLKSNMNFSISPTDFMNQYLPSTDDISNVKKECEEDKNKLNKLLKLQDQGAIDETVLKMKSTEVSTEKLLMGLCEIVLKQSIRIDKLEKLLNEKE